MKIGIDGNEANIKKRVGSGQYTYNLLKNWTAESKDEFRIFLKKTPNSDLPQPTTNWKYIIPKPSAPWLKFSLPINLSMKHRDLNVFFSPAHYSPPLLPCPLVVTIHDIAYEYFPDQFLKDDLYKLRNWTKQSIKKAAKIIAVSESTKKDIIKFYDVDKNKIAVVHNGYDKNRFHKQVKPNKSVLSSLGVSSDKYLLYVGTIQPRKNVLKLVQAFHILKKNNEYKGKLVIAGNPGWMSDKIIKGIRSSEYINDIIISGYVAQNDLPTLYKSADAFILPSLYEGFGIPILESMACGTPVAVSNNSSLPEVVGNAGELFDPNDPQDISKAILKVLKNPRSYTQKGYKLITNFSWEKTAKLTLKALKSTALEK